MTVISDLPAPFITSAPGKVIIFGEHSAVFNKHAIAASVSSLRTYLLIEPAKNEDCIELDFPDIDLDFKWTYKDLHDVDGSLIKAAFESEELSSPLVDALQPLLRDLAESLNYHAAFCFLYLYLCLCPGAKGLKFTVKSTLPIGAGLGSSASISVCLVPVSYTHLDVYKRQALALWQRALDGRGPSISHRKGTDTFCG